MVISSMPPSENSPIDFDDQDAVLAAAVRSFETAAKRAAAENDALGIPTPVGVNGTVRYVLNGRFVDETGSPE